MTQRNLGLLGMAAVLLVSFSGCKVKFHRDDGHWRRGPGHGHRTPPPPPRCHGRRCHRLVDSSVIEVSESAAALAREYQIKVTTAEVVEWLVSGEAGETDLASFGIAKEDVEALAALSMPEAAAVDRMAEAFGESRESVDRLLRGFLADIQADDQAARAGSNY
ncbi:MAG: hypothetical protein HUU37_03015 [Bdellovibrionales bacterium]|nr:hypothetical protein [Bdellovibrionales bacterium]